MNTKKRNPRDNLTPALEAVGKLTLQELNGVCSGGWTDAQIAHDEIKLALINHKTGHFYRHFIPLRQNVVSVLAGSYRGLFKLALANPRQVGRDLHEWACVQLQPFVGLALEWIRDWYILACDGENRFVRHLASTEWVPGQTVSLSVPTTVPPFPPPKSWRAPSWLFAISLALVGIPTKGEACSGEGLRPKIGRGAHSPATHGSPADVLLGLAAALETVRNEEIAAAGMIPSDTVKRETRGPNKRKGWEQRLKLYDAIRKVLSDNSGLQGMEFCAELDKRHAPPLLDWVQKGEWPEGLTWKEAWKDSRLLPKIRRVRQEAMKNR